jgi:UPF0716 family protein affecting phage T7 exclusion
MEVVVATLSVIICLALAGLLLIRDSGAGRLAQNRWRTGMLAVEGALWLAAAVVVAPTLWDLLS